ncbi:4-amino-4-deoxy-L-arabinose transferase [Cruoricaptor ignavus]|uniref:4-amino-4-deoxy-L-arabinose transferase n=1 Tax=Cruoricaptor ignavus TaxID=1118202 RepID=A0A1M6GSP7_9FLAO|nr:glycosyltransferase family 39 protein [Cruoricaptor ignavus]SHJ12960.1 4-amino-4-deoxy-L-arabinose transferase [Cruoricaptor ignavus]
MELKGEKFFWFLLLLVFAASLYHLGGWGVTETSEARYAEIPREMLEAGDWIYPRYLGILHFDKPPMTYWITMLSYKIFGISEFSARFPLQLAFLLQIFIVYKLSELLFKERDTALLSAICYASLPLVLMSIRNLTTDAYLNTFTLLTVYFYALYRKSHRIPWLLAASVSLGLGVLTKGPFAFIVPVCALYPVNKAFPAPDLWRRHWLAVVFCGILAAAVGGSWFLYLIRQSPEFYNFFIREQFIDRVSNADSLKRSEPFWYYFAFLPLLIFPCLGLLLHWIFNVRKKPSEANRLGFFTVLLPLIIFSLSSSKLVLYILSVSPFIAVCLGKIFSEMGSKSLSRVFVFNAAFALLLYLGLILLSSNAIPNLNFTVNVQMIAWLVFAGIFLAVALKLFLQKKISISLLMLFLPLIIIPLSTNYLSQIETEIGSPKPVSEFIKKEKPHSSVLAWNRVYNSVAFELKKQIYSIKYENYTLNRETRFQPDDSWKDSLLDINTPEGQQQVRSLLGGDCVFIHLKREKIPEEHGWILAELPQEKEFGKYIIRYR